MKTNRLFYLMGIALVLSASCFAQDTPKIEAGIDYSYALWNPSNFPSGTTASGEHFGNGQSLNGGGGSLVFNFSTVIGIKADVQDYGSFTTTFHNVTVNPLANATSPAVATVSGDLFTYMFGPQLKLHEGRLRPFGEALFGGAHSDIYKHLSTVAGSTFRAPSQNAFAMVVGGGLDIALNSRITFRPLEVDYLLTRFGSTNFGAGNQNSFRYVGGFVFTF
jgi:opacity protein-like surface antigen